jgi:hypothetical protein
VGTAKGSAGAAADTPNAPAAPAPNAPDAPAAPDLKARALADDGVQAMLEIFPAEIREVEEIK